MEDTPDRLVLPIQGDEDNRIRLNLDHKKILFKVTSSSSSSTSSQTHRVSIKFIVENKGLYVISPNEANVHWQISPKYAKLTTTCSCITFDPNGPYCWVPEARSLLYTLNLDQRFHDRVLYVLEDHVLMRLLGSQTHTDAEINLINVSVTIMLSNVFRLREEDIGKVDLFGRSSRGEEANHEEPEDVGGSDWVQVVVRVNGRDDEVGWKIDVDAFERVNAESDEIKALELEECQCVVCFQKLWTRNSDDCCPIVRLPCKHVFHEDCISEWFKSQPLCPLCRLDCRSARVD